MIIKRKENKLKNKKNQNKKNKKKKKKHFIQSEKLIIIGIKILIRKIYLPNK
jgi:hypothetical protein